MRKGIAIFLLLGAAMAQNAKRIYLTDHESWQQSSTLVAGSYTGATKTEQIKTLAKECTAVTITADPAKADYILSWDSKTWQQTSWGGHENEFTVYNAQKDMVGTGSAHHMKNAAKDICKMITAQPQASPQPASR